jgi:hypothetical protein
VEPTEKSQAERKREKNRRYYLANKERLNEYSREYNKKNRVRLNTYARATYDDMAKVAKKAYYERNRERILAQKKEYAVRKADLISSYRQRNKSKLSAQNSRWHRENRDKTRPRKREDSRKRSLDPSYRVAAAHRKRIQRTLKGLSKPDSSESLLGCRYDEFIDYIKAHFKRGMSMNNYGRAWHIDHVIPCSAFDLTNEVEIRQCFHFTNLRPMWAKANMRKGKKITEPQLRLLL